MLLQLFRALDDSSSTSRMDREPLPHQAPIEAAISDVGVNIQRDFKGPDDTFSDIYEWPVSRFLIVESSDFRGVVFFLRIMSSLHRNSCFSGFQAQYKTRKSKRIICMEHWILQIYQRVCETFEHGPIDSRGHSIWKHFHFIYGILMRFSIAFPERSTWRIYPNHRKILSLTEKDNWQVPSIVHPYLQGWRTFISETTSCRPSVFGGPYKVHESARLVPKYVLWEHQSSILASRDEVSESQREFGSWSNSCWWSSDHVRLRFDGNPLKNKILSVGGPEAFTRETKLGDQLKLMRKRLADEL